MMWVDLLVLTAAALGLIGLTLTIPFIYCGERHRFPPN